MSSGGGLIQLASYGNQDLYLTGTPQITFFKIVYRRHTNFSMENINLPFQGDDVNFGQTVRCRAEKSGDLMYKTYLGVIVPEVHIKRTQPIPPEPIPTCGISDTDLETATNNLELINKFVKFNMIAYRAGILNALSPCIENPSVFCDQVINSWENCDPPTHTGTIRSQVETLLLQNPILDKCYTKFDDVYLVSVANLITDLLLEDPTIDVNPILQAYLKNLTAFHKIFQDAYNNAVKLDNDRTSQFGKFAWIKRLGHYIFDYIDIEVGGKQVDRQWGDWVNIWYELSGSPFHIESYNKMIGDVPSLTTFNRETKPSYLMQIPIPFWYSKYNGLAFPLISLQYYDVDFTLKLKKLEECAYVSPDATLKNNGIALTEVFLSIDYIYLDSDERKRFAQSNQEYFIEQVQRVKFTSFSPSENTFVIDAFNHPVEELVWVFQRSDFITNASETNPCMPYNYTLDAEQTKNPVQSTSIRINVYKLGENETSNFYNYVVPWERHNRSPSEGINNYCFSLNPEASQPYGSINMSRINSLSLVCKFNPKIQAELIKGKFTVYATNYNIMRFIYGFASLSYV